MAHYIAVVTNQDGSRNAYAYESLGDAREDLEFTVGDGEHLDLYEGDRPSAEHDPVDPNSSVYLSVKGEVS